MPGLVDTILSRHHLLVVLLEDLSRESASVGSIRLRRIIYAVLLGSMGAHLDEEDVFITGEHCICGSMLLLSLYNNNLSTSSIFIS